MTRNLQPGHINAVYDDGELTLNAMTENGIHIFHVTINGIGDLSPKIEHEVIKSVEREMKRQGYQSGKVVSWSNQS